MMISYYEKLIEYWRTGKVWDAYKYFEQWKKEGLLSEEEIERVNKIIPEWGELIIEEFQESPKALLNLYETLKKVREWDDKMVCEKLKISEKNIEDIQNLRLRSKAVVNKILLEFIQGITTR
jgi:hypothetical protein